MLSEVEGRYSFRADVVNVAVGRLVVSRAMIFHPVDHIGSVPIESLDMELIEIACIGGAEMPVGALFGLQLLVALQSRTIVVNVCVRGSSQALVEGCEEPPAVGRTPTEVDAWVELHTAFDRGVVIGEHTDGDSQIFQQDVVLQIEAEVAASVFIFVVLVVTWHFVFVLFRCWNFLAKSGGEDVLASEFEADGRLAECPSGVGIEVDAIDVGLVEILIGLRIGTLPHIVVKGTVPIDLHGDADGPLVFSLGSHEVAAILLILRVGTCAVECVGAVVHGAETCLKSGIEVGTPIFAIPVGVGFVEVVVACAAIATGVGSADAVEEVGSVGSEMSVGSKRAVGTGLHVSPECVFHFRACDDVDGSGEGLAAIHAAGSSFDDLDALDVIHADRQIDCQVTCVGVADVDAVQQDGELILGATVYTDVGLYAESSTLAHIHASGEFQQVVHRIGARRLDVLSVNHLHEAHRLVGRQGGECAHHLGIIQRQFPLIPIVDRGSWLTEGHDGRSGIGAGGC